MRILRLYVNPPKQGVELPAGVRQASDRKQQFASIPEPVKGRTIGKPSQHQVPEALFKDLIRPGDGRQPTVVVDTGIGE